MDNLQYVMNVYIGMKIESFKPYYKWIIFNMNMCTFNDE